VNGQSIVVFVYLNTQFSQLDHKISDSIGFLDTIMGNVANTCCTFDKHSDRCKRLHGIAYIRHVDVDSMFGRPNNGDFIFAPFNLASHLSQAIDKSNVALK